MYEYKVVPSRGISTTNPTQAALDMETQINIYANQSWELVDFYIIGGVMGSCYVFRKQKTA